MGESTESDRYRTTWRTMRLRGRVVLFLAVLAPLVGGYIVVRAIFKTEDVSDLPLGFVPFGALGLAQWLYITTRCPRCRHPFSGVDPLWHRWMDPLTIPDVCGHCGLMRGAEGDPDSGQCHAPSQVALDVQFWARWRRSWRLWLAVVVVAFAYAFFTSPRTSKVKWETAPSQPGTSSVVPSAQQSAAPQPSTPASRHRHWRPGMAPWPGLMWFQTLESARHMATHARYDGSLADLAPPDVEDRLAALRSGRLRTHTLTFREWVGHRLRPGLLLGQVIERLGPEYSSVECDVMPRWQTLAYYVGYRVGFWSGGGDTGPGELDLLFEPTESDAGSADAGDADWRLVYAEFRSLPVSINE